jgi:hypothetical protein
MYRNEISVPIANHTLFNAVCSACLVALGLWTFIVEAPPFFSDGWSEQTMVEAASSGTISPGLSNASKLAYLFNCRVAMTSVTGRAQPTAVRQAIAYRCLKDADSMTSASPPFAVASFTGALAAATLQDWRGMNERLRQAYDNGRNELWQAEMRVDLVEANTEHIERDVWPRHLEDLRLLLLYDGGRQFLVARYHALHQLRRRIDLLVFGLAEPDRIRFQNMTARAEKERLRSNGR